MKEVKTPKKPLIYYYGIVLLVLIVFNLVVSPILMEHQVEETDYGTFMSMINDKDVYKRQDLHIGLKLINRDLREDQEYILDQIIQKAAEKVPDAIVIAGDIYDKACLLYTSLVLQDIRQHCKRRGFP